MSPVYEPPEGGTLVSVVLPEPWRETGPYQWQDDGDTFGPGRHTIPGISGYCDNSTVVGKMTASKLYSGWGVRTMGAREAGYNPLGYHTGTVWPHDNALIAAGLKRYDRHEAANVLATGLFEAAQAFPAYRLPELFCGFPRLAGEPPVADRPASRSPLTASGNFSAIGAWPSASAGASVSA